MVFADEKQSADSMIDMRRIGEASLASLDYAH
jgi:hypothetical protein